MFKDYNKYLKASLKVYIFVLLIVFILKLVGLDYFGLDLNNQIIIYLSKLVSTNIIINNIVFVSMLAINQYFMTSLTLKDNSNKMKMYNLIVLPFSYALQGLKRLYPNNYFFLIETLFLFIIVIIYNKKIDKQITKRFVKVILLIYFVQLISIFTRVRYSIEYINNPIMNIILNLDYFLSLIIIYKIIFKKGDEKLCGCQVEVGSSLLKKKHLSDLLEKLQRNYSNFKKYNKVDKATIVIYTILSLIWNIFTIIVVLFVAKLNDTFIECLFIISSFWLSKKVFGKPFHLKSMIGCFIVSNASYYVLNRVTTPIGISILVPIMLGVGLSYVTSKFVKDIKPLFKGMSEEDFNNTILRVVEKDSDKYKICYDFFIKKENAISLGYKYNYTEAGIRKIIYRINEKIKTLN